MESLTEVLTCSSCNADIAEDDSKYYDGEHYCTDCFNDNFCMCNDCERIIPNDESYVVDNGDKVICENCYCDNYFTCESCSEIYPLDNSYSAHGDCFCDHCFHEYYVYCDCCDSVVSRDNYYNVYDTEECVCDYCSGYHYQYCDECNNYYSEECECGINGGNAIRNHTYKPAPNFHGKGKLHFGFELEIENNNGLDSNEIAKRITEALNGLIYCKRDGSLNSGGFEIVSHPFTFDFLKNHLLKKNKLNPIFELRTEGFRSYNTDTCGMHVHLSKKAFTDLHLYKFMKFFYENPRFVWKFSQRKLSNFNRWSTLTEDNQPIMQKVKEKQNPSRYIAVNLNNNHTVEIRIFRGTLKKEGFLRNVEFCHAVFEFTKNASLQKANNLNDFYTFVSMNKTKYSNLYDSITRRDLRS